MNTRSKSVWTISLTIAVLVAPALSFWSTETQGGAAGTTDLTVIKGARLIDGNGKAPIKKAVIVIDGEKIKSVFREGEAPIPSGAVIINAEGKSVLPGLIDVHVHFDGKPGAGTSPDEFGQVRRLHDLKAFLYSGVTTFKSLGDDPKMILGLRRRESVEHRISPRIFAVGRMFTAPGGHPAGTVFRDLPKDIVDANVFQVDTEEQVRTAINIQVADHVDGVKIIYDGGSPSHPIPRLKLELLRLIIAEAHGNNLIVSVHCGSAQDVRDSVLSGADGIEHADQEELADDTLKMMAERGIFFTPTLVVFDQSAKFYKGINLADDALVAGCVSPGLLRGLSENQAKLMETYKNSRERAAIAEQRLATAKLNTRRALALGVRICTGTDAGNMGVFFGPALHQELVLMVEAGLTPMQAITAGTRNAAMYIGALDRIGTVEPGKLADLFIVDGDPSKDIKATNKIWMVIKGGQPINRESLFGDATK